MEQRPRLHRLFAEKADGRMRRGEAGEIHMTLTLACMSLASSPRTCSHTTVWNQTTCEAGLDYCTIPYPGSGREEEKCGRPTLRSKDHTTGKHGAAAFYGCWKYCSTTAHAHTSR